MAIDSIPADTPYDERLPNGHKLNKESRLGTFRLSTGVVLSLAMLGIGTDIKGCTPEEPSALEQKTPLAVEKATVDPVSEYPPLYEVATKEYAFRISERNSVDE